MKYNIKDIYLCPSAIPTEVNQCNIYDNNKMLPFFMASPAEFITGSTYEILNSEKINTIISVFESLELRLKLITNSFVNLSDIQSDMIIDMLSEKFDPSKTYNICINYPTKNYSKFLENCKILKSKFGDNLRLMINRVNSPELYKELCKIGVDFAILNGREQKYLGFEYPDYLLLKESCDVQWEMEQTIKNSKHLKLKCPFRVTSIIMDMSLDLQDDYLTQINEYLKQAVKAFVLGANYVIIRDQNIYNKIYYNNTEKIEDIVKTIRCVLEFNLGQAMSTAGITQLNEFKNVKYIIDK